MLQPDCIFMLNKVTFTFLKTTFTSLKVIFSPLKVTFSRLKVTFSERTGHERQLIDIFKKQIIRINLDFPNNNFKMNIYTHLIFRNEFS